ncbi:lipoyl(octanoyl) transferase LipB [Rarobacter faecitabidus]|uniref:Octanoyltransferase n=1 Tax=Rarobacter faecitabidus TaxID=13243 RepID=A0A542ZV91_RARFA|nr:lipoyl(octanoyl) transferase LipB [Rarobacter faecitabidus]TQL64273.1 lipoyl(octanoyl) transferase [Rarobacter faecitabidus]
MEFVSLDVGSRTRDYEEIWQLQRDVHADVAAGRRDNTVLFVEHDAVFTAGKRTNRSDRPTDGARVIDVDRGGRITWHGPGQLVAYPIVRLAEPIDVVKYVRALEQAVIDLCSELGAHTIRVEDRSGVWFAANPLMRDRKVCAIGVRVARGTTMHGIALNCDANLADYGRIVPCGIDDAGVTTLTRELRRPFTVTDALPLAQKHLATQLAPIVQPGVTHVTQSAS